MANDIIKTLQMFVLELSAEVKALKEEIHIIASGGFKPAGSVYFADLPSLIDERYGFVYNIKDDFITTSDFIEGAGKRYSAGTNVGIIKDDNNNLKYDTLASFVDTAAIYEAIGVKQNINLSEAIAGASTVEGALKAINQSASITVDAEISSTSTNPVQNKVIKGQLDLKLDADGKANSATSADYATKAERDSHDNVISSTYATKTELSDGLSGKVNAVAGKGLSSNDYTNEDKDYVDGLPAQLLGKQDKYETITYAQWQAMTPAQKAEKDYYISNYPASVLTAGNIAYDNTESGMDAEDTQEAIDELKSGLAGLGLKYTQLLNEKSIPTEPTLYPCNWNKYEILIIYTLQYSNRSGSIVIPKSWFADTSIGKRAIIKDVVFDKTYYIFKNTDSSVSIEASSTSDTHGVLIAGISLSNN